MKNKCYRKSLAEICYARTPASRQAVFQSALDQSLTHPSATTRNHVSACDTHTHTKCGMLLTDTIEIFTHPNGDGELSLPCVFGISATGVRESSLITLGISSSDGEGPSASDNDGDTQGIRHYTVSCMLRGWSVVVI